MMAIIECALYDFLCHIKEERHEGVNLSKKEKESIRDKNLPKQFHKYVEICENHKLLGNNKPDIYIGLYKYIKIRNRVHIQNLNQTAPPDECDLWDYNKIESCGRLLHDVFRYLCENHPRPKRFHSNPDLDSFPTPWTKLE